MIKYGDLLLIEIIPQKEVRERCKKTFRYIGEYEGGLGGPDCIVEAVDDVDPFDCWPACRLHDDYYAVYLSDATLIPKDSPQTFVGWDMKKLIDLHPRWLVLVVDLASRTRMGIA